MYTTPMPPKKILKDRFELMYMTSCVVGVHFDFIRADTGAQAAELLRLKLKSNGLDRGLKVYKTSKALYQGLDRDGN